VHPGLLPGALGDQMTQPEVSSSALQNRQAIKMLLADDSKIVRDSIRQLLSSQNEIEIVAEAAGFSQTIRLANNLNPSIIVMDLHMSDENCISPQQLRYNLNPGPQLLAMSLWNDKDTESLAQSFGAAVLLDKVNLASTLIPTIVRLCR
jgi:two-component system, chemotaxis family, protein-glutamate methylesterase/glutaminase